jgi:hypothetical protein
MKKTAETKAFQQVFIRYVKINFPRIKGVSRMVSSCQNDEELRRIMAEQPENLRRKLSLCYALTARRLTE